MPHAGTPLEKLGTVDVLSGGRLNPGVSVGPPMHWDDVKAALYPDTADAEDFGYERVKRLVRFLAGERATTFRGRAPGTAARRCGRRGGPGRQG